MTEKVEIRELNIQQQVESVLGMSGSGAEYQFEDIRKSLVLLAQTMDEMNLSIVSTNDEIVDIKKAILFLSTKVDKLEGQKR